MARGFNPRGGGNMQNMMRQMQKAQRQMEEAQRKIEETEITTTSGGGMVEVVVNGKNEVLSVTIDPEVLDPEDVDILQDMIVVAVNDGLRQVAQLSEREMSKVTGGLNIPGL